MVVKSKSEEMKCIGSQNDAFSNKTDFSSKRLRKGQPEAKVEHESIKEND
jgi:hypothetical protein